MGVLSKMESNCKKISNGFIAKTTKRKQKIRPLSDAWASSSDTLMNSGKMLNVFYFFYWLSIWCANADAVEMSRYIYDSILFYMWARSVNMINAFDEFARKMITIRKQKDTNYYIYFFRRIVLIYQGSKLY